MSHEYVVELQQLKKSFFAGERQLPVIQGIDLQIRHGEFVAVMGTSGSGKSTLLNILGGLLRADSGQVSVDRCDLMQLEESALTVFRREHIGFVFQMFNLVPTLNVRENILLPSLAGGKRIPNEQVIELIAPLGMEQRQNAMPYTLSGGEQQRVAIARALIGNPALVLADEPTGNLDSENTRIIKRLFRQMHQRYHCAFVLVTHDPTVAMWAQRILLLKDGKIVSDCSAEDFADAAELSAFYEHVIG